jgi:hypothetical protein
VEDVLSVMSDIFIQSVDEHEIVAISQNVGVPGETMLLALTADEESAPHKVRAVDSRPVIVDGAVRHRVRFLRLGGADGEEREPAADR